MVWRSEDPQGNEAAKCRFDIVPYTRGAVLDLGCGPNKAFPHFIGVDNLKDVELFGIQMKPDLVIPDCSNLQSHVEDASCDAIFSSHLLEHIEDTRAALRSWWQTIKVDGHLVLYLPHRDLYPRIGTEGSNPDHKHDFHPDDIITHMRAVGSWDLLVNEDREEGTEYSFLQVYRKRDANDGRRTLAYKYRPQKTACVVRYGGFGDQLQAANILPELKRQGYHVTFNTTPTGQEVLREDPNIDAWFIQDRDQVANHDLWEYWAAWSKKFDRWINLSSSVEDTLLATPGRPEHMWPHALRHKLCNVNYLERTAEIAEVPMSTEARFYPSREEENKALALLRADDARKQAFNIMWVLGGSSPHKFYPGQDVVIAEILRTMPDARVILAGDMACKILEAGWEEVDRVLCTSGEMGIRDTLTLAKHCDVVIGPETGVLNAVAFEDNAKVVLLSHSSVENLTKHWVRTSPIVSQKTPCYPCHQLHVSTRYCPTAEDSGAARCQADISPDEVFAAVKWEYALWCTHRAGIAA